MSHHAYLLKVAVPQNYTFADEGDVVYVDFERLGVGEVRTLTQTATRMPHQMSHQTLVIRTTQVTVEAQNALLKLFEEPPVTTRFQLVIPPQLQLLSTLLSRMQIKEDQQLTDHTAWEVFQSATVSDRMRQIDEWQKQKNTAWVLEIQTGLLAWLQTDAVPSPALQLVADRLNTRGASNKMLLELLALEI